MWVYVCTWLKYIHADRLVTHIGGPPVTRVESRVPSFDFQ